MFVFISMLISIAILGGLFFFAKQKESSLQRKYQLLVDLRELLYLCRQHRQATHHELMFGQDRQQEIDHLQSAIDQTLSHLIAHAHFDNKPLYRIFQAKLTAIRHEWPDYSVARNQVAHGKAIRHCLFLIDEIVLAWLAESHRDDLSDEYHMNWQQVIDSMDSLTQLRLCIEEMGSQEGRLRLSHYSELMRRKLSQLALISPLSIASPTCSEAMHQLSELHDNPHLELDAKQFYQLTSELSLTIAQVYDQMLSEVTESLYLPLPQLALA
ncbi:hypothetical protein H8R01_09685 [Vibrio metschnikovii]|uniref:hypothetical protein n=1 Tax=Vibrio metschnikovii TaxID=28172 RepID=UPI0016479A35|nr:hypothetical protein [Vibrio metschnikovii]MBC3617597.1 hypothetical protein [Vibrio metschnikovii]MBC3620510.1 hypothetical protein [Vibrio metschnikovii]MBC5813609.1 hypothetical protein [Vibrio metschnikovii]